MDATERIAGMKRLAQGFMTPQVWRGTCFELDTRAEGIVRVDSSTMGKEELECEYPPEKRMDPDKEAEGVLGWWCQLSASGYMDQTDISGPFDSEEAAEEFLVETYGDDESEEE